MKALFGKIVRRAIGRCPYCAQSPYRTNSYSQEGEDRILARMLEGRPQGFYVDIGAHHPKRFSNTYLFYEMGWRGINIEPTPHAMDAFGQVRPRDINLPIGIAGQSGELTFYEYDEPAFNSFDPRTKTEFAKRGHPKLINEHRIRVESLRDVLSKHLPAGQKIDFLSIDAEGLDFEILRSNDWQKFRPDYVLLEDGHDVASALASPSAKLLAENGYALHSRTHYTSVWERRA
jgi:FkbM family methyltransferase